MTAKMEKGQTVNVPATKKKPASKKAVIEPAPKKFVEYIATEAHATNHVIRTVDTLWRAKSIDTTGHYIWRIPAEDVERFEKHHAFVQGRVKRHGK
ncbi:hypothetical protein GCM10023116_48280 [Kistimonas scapharcae]|uniref:Uncharacterized protein n=1 Tax=Kistimonas scapharcae TaxID=1036133 RepID=A0ABP8VAX8_9GAMM